MLKGFYTEGCNVVFEARWAKGKLDRLNDLATELVGLKVDVITTMSTPAVLAARNATTTIPIVFIAVGDSVGLALPGGNGIGISLLATELSGKRLEILQQIARNGFLSVCTSWSP